MGIRQDVNDLVRDQKGRVSTSRVGLLIGQWLVVKLVLENGTDIIANWDSLLVLFLVLVAPDALRKFASMKYGGISTETTYEESGRASKTVVRDLSRE